LIRYSISEGGVWLEERDPFSEEEFHVPGEMTKDGKETLACPLAQRINKKHEKE
jgi:hypothetical protein